MKYSIIVAKKKKEIYTKITEAFSNFLIKLIEAEIIIEFIDMFTGFVLIKCVYISIRACSHADLIIYY